VIGIVLGIVLGIGVIVLFVFEGSEDVIDAPRISGIEGSQPPPGLRVPLVRVVGGMPPAGGPVRLDFKQGQTARFVVGSDQAIGIEIPGYGVNRSVQPGRTLVTFEADRAGQYPLRVSASGIDIANLRVAPR
jgi:hypothetical protein